jgi:hypothetical protein
MLGVPRSKTLEDDDDAAVVAVPLLGANCNGRTMSPWAASRGGSLDLSSDFGDRDQTERAFPPPPCCCPPGVSDGDADDEDDSGSDVAPRLLLRMVDFLLTSSVMPIREAGSSRGEQYASTSSEDGTGAIKWNSQTNAKVG